jgi:hypothetical protein
MWRNPFARPFSSESPAHQWRGSVRQTLKSHRSAAPVACCRCHELPPAVSGCLVLAATFFHRPGEVRASRSCSWSDERKACSHVDLKSHVEGGD